MRGVEFTALTEVGIGFRYIAPELMKPGALFGAEESGSVGLPATYRNETVWQPGLFLLEMLAMEKRSVNQIYAWLEREFGPHRYARYDATYPLEKRAALMKRLQSNPPEKLLRSPLAKVEARDGGEICGGRFHLADVAWFGHRTGLAHLCGGEIGRGRAEVVAGGPGVVAQSLTGT